MQEVRSSTFDHVKSWIVAAWADGWPGRFALAMTFITFTCLLFVPVAFWKVAHDWARWREFSAAHQCRKVAHVRGDVNFTPGVFVGANGKVGTGTGLEIENDRTAWLCDDGVTYWR